jgi:hypothetical protein
MYKAVVNIPDSFWNSFLSKITYPLCYIYLASVDSISFNIVSRVSGRLKMIIGNLSCCILQPSWNSFMNSVWDCYLAFSTVNSIELFAHTRTGWVYTPSLLYPWKHPPGFRLIPRRHSLLIFCLCSWAIALAYSCKRGTFWVLRWDLWGTSLATLLLLSPPLPVGSYFSR